jgi:hypothetical protein
MPSDFWGATSASARGIRVPAATVAAVEERNSRRFMGVGVGLLCEGTGNPPAV